MGSGAGRLSVLVDAHAGETVSTWQKVVLSALLGVVAWTAYGAAQRAVGRRDQQIRTLTHALDSAAKVGRGLDTVFLRDTVRLTRTRIERDTVFATVERFLHDTVPVPVEVVREIVRADSLVIQACTDALNTCEQRVANLTDRLALSERRGDVWRRQASPSLLRQLTDKLPALGLGVVLGVVLK